MGIVNLTPAMKQYVEIKEKHQDCILFYRMGDFYEMFFEDAVTASKVLEITLTSRNKGKEDGIPLCGVPYHAASAYITKLIENGFKVAVVEQVEDPKTAKGIVRREVVRIITPGLLIDDDQLPPKENNFLAAIAAENGRLGLAFVDISTGDFRVMQSDDRAEDRDYLLNELASLGIREIAVSEEIKGGPLLKRIQSLRNDCLITYLPAETFTGDSAELIRTTFDSASLARIRFDSHPAAASAAGAVLRYVGDTQQNRLRHVRSVEWHQSGNYLYLDETARRNMELFATIQEMKKKGSLFHVMDETVTSMGGRRLRWWLSYPLIDPAKIDERLSAVGEIRERHLLREELRSQLGGIHDLQRLAGRIAMDAANARDLVALKNSLRRIPAVREALREFEAPLLVSILSGTDEMRDVADLIEASILDDPSPTLRDGGMIREGFDPELDGLISIMRDGKRWIVLLEEKERKRTGINSLKVGFNSIFGYYIEITPRQRAPRAGRLRPQADAGQCGAVHQPGAETARGHASSMPRNGGRSANTRSSPGSGRRSPPRSAGSRRRRPGWPNWTRLPSLAEVAERYNYCRPVVDEEDRIDISDGRHPVVERMPLAEGFVPNDTCLEPRDAPLLIITGPNMAGKSTYIRQVALIVLMAQMGSFVPAGAARIGVVDRIFTRVGASDNLARGQSTFMVEMTETANILKQATPRSLIILDEIGRGTSTFDGLSIAWAVAEYIHDRTSRRPHALRDPLPRVDGHWRSPWKASRITMWP